MSSSQEQPKELSPYSSLIITPGQNPELLKVSAENTQSLVLVTNASGSLSRELHARVKEIIDSGKPVFILPDTPGSEEGVTDRGDELLEATRDLGVTFLSSANVNHEEAVCSAIRSAVEEGLSGDALKEAIIKQFS